VLEKSELGVGFVGPILKAGYLMDLTDIWKQRGWDDKLHALAKDIRIEDSKPGFSGITLAHNVATREEVLEIIETVRKAGCRIVKEPQKVDWGDNTGAYFADPDGHLWEITDLGAGYLEHVPSDPSVKKRETV
jgi:catechol 2,3-dioxygenase-like lactoylglutathione lyase family enzyme